MGPDQQIRRGTGKRPSAKSLLNLRPPYQKGEINNPDGNNGKPKRLLTSELLAQLERDPQLLHDVARALIDGALAGEPAHMRELWLRSDGHVSRDHDQQELPEMVVEVQPLQLNGHSHQPVPLPGLPSPASQKRKSVGRDQALEVEVERLPHKRKPAPVPVDDDDEEDDEDEE